MVGPHTELRTALRVALRVALRRTCRSLLTRPRHVQAAVLTGRVPKDSIVTFDEFAQVVDEENRGPMMLELEKQLWSRTPPLERINVITDATNRSLALIEESEYNIKLRKAYVMWMGMSYHIRLRQWQRYVTFSKADRAGRARSQHRRQRRALAKWFEWVSESSKYR